MALEASATKTNAITTQLAEIDPLTLQQVGDPIDFQDRFAPFERFPTTMVYHPASRSVIVDARRGTVGPSLTRAYLP